MFLRHVTNTKKTQAYMDDEYICEVNCNGMQFIYALKMNVFSATYTIEAFKNEAWIHISIFTHRAPRVTYTRANFELSITYDCDLTCLCTRVNGAKSDSVVDDFSSPHHDLLRNLRIISMRDTKYNH